MAIEKETLKKDTILDPYLEKLVELKLMQGKESFINKFNLMKGWSEDLTANKNGVINRINEFRRITTEDLALSVTNFW